jgi:hypothetical protein
MQKIHFHSFETIFDEKHHNLAFITIVTSHRGAFSLKFVRWVKTMQFETRNGSKIRRKAPALSFEFFDV